MPLLLVHIRYPFLFNIILIKTEFDLILEKNLIFPLDRKDKKN